MSETTVTDSYLKYPHRRYGMDHDRYEWSMLADRPKISWPDNRLLALWVNVPLQYFPLNQRGEPFKVPGGMTMPYPDLRHYSLRDYGNRVGVYRFFSAFDTYGITPTYAVNTRLAERTPYLMSALKERNEEILCHGLHMDALHYGEQDKSQEAEQIKQALTGLREITGQEISGWLSPAKNQSMNTPDLLAEQGIHYMCDWVNDDMPYFFKTATDPLISMPLSTELEDRFVIQNNLHSEESWAEQICDACDYLINEARESGGRVLALNIHPWLLGQPHRIGYLEQVLAYLSAKTEVWSASAGRIAAHWEHQQAS